MLQVTKKKMFAPLEDPEIDLSKIASIMGSGRPTIPLEVQKGADEALPSIQADEPLPPPPAQYQDISIGPETLTPRTGQTIDQYPSLAAEPFQPQAQNQPAAPAKQLSPLEDATANYEKAVSEPAHKQGKAAQAANFALQFIQDVFDPGPHEYQWLGNMKKQNRVDQAARTLAPLQAQETYKEKIRQQKAQTQNTLDKPAQIREAAAAKVQAAIDADKRRMDLVNRRADIASGEAKIETDDKGLRWLVHLKPDSSGKLRDKEPLENPLTHEQDFDPGEQMVTDPLTGNPVKAKQILGPQAMIASADATREQQAATTNVSNQIKVDQENINNNIQYHANIAKMISDAAVADSGINDGEFQGLNEQIAGKNTEYNSVANQDFSGITDPDDREKARKKQFDDLNKIAAESTELRTKALASMSKTVAGKARADAIRANLPPEPKKLTYTPIKAVKVGGIGTYSESDFTARAKAKGITGDALKQAIAKARQDGIIK